MTIYALLDYDAHGCSKATGRFQVIHLKDDENNDLSDWVTIGREYASLEELRRELDLLTGMTLPPVVVYEED